MAFIPALNTARVSVNMRLHGQKMQNVFHVQKASAWSEAELVDLANLFITWANDELATVQSTDAQYESVSARDMTTQEGLGVEVGFPPASGGDIANPGMPGNVALAVKHLTGLTGRSRRGRSFLGGIPENAQEGNEVTLAFRDAIDAVFEALLTALTTAAFEWVVASFFHGVDAGTGEPIPRPTALLTPITGTTVDLNLDSQRRRLASRGV